MRKVRMLCPRCGVDSSGEDWIVEHVIEFIPRVIDNTLLLTKDGLLTEKLVVKHRCGFQNDEYPPEGFTITVENNTIVDWDWYWEEHLPALEVIATHKGWEVKEDARRTKDDAI